MAEVEPLNELDAALLGLQREGRPWSVHFEVELEDPIAPTALVTGLAHVLRCHPRAGAALERSGKTPRWRLGCFGGRDLLVESDLPVDEVRRQLLDHRFRLETEPPVRVAALDGGRRLIVAMNHAVSDGLGGARLVHDLLVGTSSSDEGEVCAAVPPGLAKRLAPRHGLATLASTAATARYVLAGGASTAAAVAEPTTVVATSLEPELRQRLLTAPPSGLGVNDVLLAASHLALHEVIGDGRRVAVSVPVDLRRHIGSPPGLGNGIVSALTSSGRGATTDGPRLAATVGSSHPTRSWAGTVNALLHARCLADGRRVGVEPLAPGRRARGG